MILQRYPLAHHAALWRICQTTVRDSRVGGLLLYLRTRTHRRCTSFSVLFFFGNGTRRKRQHYNSRSLKVECSCANHSTSLGTAVMFFKNKNGDFIRVPQVGNGGPQGKLINKGGLDVYYIPRGNVTAFKKVSCSRHKL
jgi:hypothetical protein